jgi:single-stranded DNA-binding protein
MGRVKFNRPEEITGVLEYDPELRFTPRGHPVANFVIIDHETGEKTQCELWRIAAEEFIEQFTPDRRMAKVTIWGSRKHRSWNDRNGEIRITESFNVIRYEFP